MTVRELSSQAAVAAKLAAFPRYRLSCLPTPLQKLNRLSERLGVNLFIKREDQTGLAFGGNKARKLEYIIADVLAQGCDTIITWAGLQSNWCRQTAAAARMAGINPILVLFKRPGLPAEQDGNLLLDFIFDADLRVIEIGPGQGIMELSAIVSTIDAIIEETRAAGHKPYVAPIGGSMTEGSMVKPWGAISYVNALLEMLSQIDEIDDIVLATGSGSTQAGLLAGAKLACPQTRIVGISVSDPAESVTRWVETLTAQTLEAFDVKSNTSAEETIVFDQYIDGGYGVLNEQTTRAIRLLAESEGILLDPVYTGRAMAGFLDLLERGYFTPGKNIVFMHTGGTPAIFPYREKIAEFLERDRGSL